MEENKNVAIKAEKDHTSAVESAYDYLEHFDILETITNVGNDEVFTPRKTCDMILDSLPDEVWHNPNYKWLNPATKNGIFEREIAIRLDRGLKDIIPDEETRKKHILQNMIFAIGQTKFTANVARRTLYYCSQANRKCDGIKAPDGHYVNGYAIGNGTWFDDEEGNIKTPRTEHVFERNGKCKFCGIPSSSKYNSPDQREHYAYEFIHYGKLALERHLQDLFFKGDRTMKFDVIVGNPPYMLTDGGGGSSSKPIYNLFVLNAIALAPKYISMIIPSRWMTGGKGLDTFRDEMINDKRISVLHDFLNAGICFPSVAIEGGVCYFLWEKQHIDKCNVVTHQTNGELRTSFRYLNDQHGGDIYIRDDVAIGILNKVKNKTNSYFDSIVSTRMPFGIGNMSIDDTLSTPQEGNDLKIFMRANGKREFRYSKNKLNISKNTNLIEKYKIFISKADGAAGQIGNPIPARIIGKGDLGGPHTICTETFLVVGPFDDKASAENCIQYMKTKFFRFLVGIRKNKNMTQDTYKYAPLLDFSSVYNDKELYKHFNLNDEEIKYIETMIQEMN